MGHRLFPNGIGVPPDDRCSRLGFWAADLVVTFQNARIAARNAQIIRRIRLRFGEGRNLMPGTAAGRPAL